MPNTYYDSELTGEQIEAALSAIHGVVTPQNNGKVLAIEDGAIVAKSASEWTDTPVLEPLSVTANGDYTPDAGVDGYNAVHVAVPGAGNIQPLNVTENGTYNPPSGVDGYSPVTVNVSGGGGALVKRVSIITASDIVTEFDSEISTGGVAGLEQTVTQPSYFYTTWPTDILFADLGVENTSGTIYAVIKSLVSGGDYGGIVFDYNWSIGTAPMFYTRSNTWLTGAYGQDQSTGISSNVFRVLALAVNGTSKTTRHFIGSQKIRDNVIFTNSGRYGSWGGGYSNTGAVQAASHFNVAYGALVRGVETDQEILDNMAKIQLKYASILGT